MKESMWTNLTIAVAAIMVAWLGGMGGFEIGRRAMTPQVIRMEQENKELENRLMIDGHAWVTIMNAVVAVKQVETVLGGTRLAKLGIPVNSFAVTAEDGRIFVFYMLDPAERPEVVQEIYGWETDNSPRELLKKLSK